MFIDGKWYDEPEIQAYIKSLKDENEAKLVTACNMVGKLKIEKEQAVKLLRESHLLLYRAFFAHYLDKKAADELYDRITKYFGSNTE